MKAVLQRVTEGMVDVCGVTVGSIGRGFVVLLCVEKGDTESEAALFAAKIAKMRVFADAEGRLNRSLLETSGAVLVISQFTLCGDWRRGNRPSFSNAAAPETARSLYDFFCEKLRFEGIEKVETGSFAAEMSVRIVNDGPVTIWMDSTQR